MNFLTASKLLPSLYLEEKNKFNKLLDQLELLNLKPKLFISSYFDDLVNQIDLDAETALF
jgi:hypothetical protein